LRPILKVLFASGYTDAFGPQRELEPSLQLLAKPYRQTDLAQAIRRT
jgi:hypothetical protein